MDHSESKKLSVEDYRRQKQHNQQQILNNRNSLDEPVPSTSSGNNHDFNSNNETVRLELPSFVPEAVYSGSSADDDSVINTSEGNFNLDFHVKEENDRTIKVEESLETFVRKWAASHNINDNDLRPLMEKLNSNCSSALSGEAQPIRGPEKSPVIREIEGGRYYHHGLESALRKQYWNLSKPTTIEININIDCLPLYHDSTAQFWPIVFNVHECPHIMPMTIGYFYGPGKPVRVNEFLDDFVTEAREILQSGVIIGKQKLDVKLRALLCAPSARAFIQGIADAIGHTQCPVCSVSYRRFDAYPETTDLPPAAKRNKRNEDFRREIVDHRNYDIRIGNRMFEMVPVQTPLEKLFPGIEDNLIVADSMYLLHFGIVKGLLLEYTKGIYDWKESHWRGARLSMEVLGNSEEIFKSIQMPIEIPGTTVNFRFRQWNANQYAAFLNYFGIGILRYWLDDGPYETFLTLFCATTICSTNYFRDFWSLAGTLFEKFVGNFHQLSNSQTNDLHLLGHVVEQCERFGPLPTISSQLFAKHLSEVDRLLKSGHYIFMDIAKNIEEIRSTKASHLDASSMYPIFSNRSKEEPSKYATVAIRRGLKLTTDPQDKWFFTKSREIVAMEYAGGMGIVGSQLQEYNEFFEKPMKSSVLNVFFTKDIKSLKKPKRYEFSDVLCKFVVTTLYDGQSLFVPLHESYPDS